MWCQIKWLKLNYSIVWIQIVYLILNFLILHIASLKWFWKQISPDQFMPTTSWQTSTKTIVDTFSLEITNNLWELMLMTPLSVPLLSKTGKSESIIVLMAILWQIVILLCPVVLLLKVFLMILISCIIMYL